MFRAGASPVRGSIRLPLLALVASLASPAAAQVSAPTRDDLSVGRSTQSTSRTGQLAIEGAVERGPCPFNESSFASIKVTFGSVEFAGLPGIPASTLDAAWQNLAGNEQPITALCDIRDRAATLLSNAGYLAAVQIPPQRIEKGGTVHMDILAAKLVELQVRGDAGQTGDLIAGQLKPLTDEPYFNANDAERSLLLLQDLPGYDARLTLRSAQRDPGEVIGDVRIAYKPVEFAVGVQNYGSKATGREGAFAEIAFNGLLGLGDRTTASVYNTFDWKEQTILRLGHELALNANGLRFGGSILYGRSRPDVAGGGFKSETLAGEFHLRGAVERRQASSLFATAGLEIVDQKLSFAGTQLSKDQLRIAFGRLEWLALDQPSLSGAGGFTPREPRWRAALTAEVRKGLGFLGASDGCSVIAACAPPNVPISDILANPQALVARVEGTIEYRPIPKLALAVMPLLQIANDRLLSYEQASLGNYTIGRGLDPGTVLADDVIGASFELRAGSLTPSVRGGLALQPFVFLDFANGWTDDAALAPDPRNVLTAGGGIRASWADRFDFALVLAEPLQRAGFQTARGDTRLLFTATARLLPWGEN